MARGADWREVSRKILESLESVRTDADGMNIGFLYTTDVLTGDLEAMLSLLKSVTRIAHWYGSTGQGICGGGMSHAGEPAAVAMIGRMPDGAFHGFVLPDSPGSIPDSLKTWMAGTTPVAALTHGILCAQGAQRLRHFRDRDGFYTVGGFAAAAGGAHICDGLVVKAGDVLSGLALDGQMPVLTATSFGCIPAGGTGRITQCAGGTIESIDDMPAALFLRDAIDRLDLHGENRLGENRPGETAPRRGHVHAAFPITGADKGQYLVRNINSVDEARGSIAVAHGFARGDAIQFVYRDRQTATADLTQVLTKLYGRAADMVGAANLKPKALLYFGCGARLPDTVAEDEARLIAQVFSGVPMAGFYTAAEICNGHVYGYTGVIVLML